MSPRPKFIEETKQARNASEALLAALSSCVGVSQALSTIDWPSLEAFGTWLKTLQGQRVSVENPVAFSCLNHLNLGNCILSFQDLCRTNLSGARLVGANLSRANLSEVRLVGTKLSGANLFGARLANARLSEANLTEARLVGTNLSGARLDRANLAAANLSRANLFGARLFGARLAKARLNKISWDEQTDWQQVEGINTAQNVPEALKQQLGLSSRFAARSAQSHP